MRTRRLRFGLGSLLMLTAACAIGSLWLRGPVIRAAIEPVGLVTLKDGSRAARFRIANTGTDSLWYTGNYRNTPWYTSETHVAGRLLLSGPVPFVIDILPSSHELKPGEAAEFNVSLAKGATAVKGGLHVSTREPEWEDEDAGSDSAMAWGIAWSKPERNCLVWSEPLVIPADLSAAVQAAAPSSDP